MIFEVLIIFWMSDQNIHFENHFLRIVQRSSYSTRRHKLVYAKCG